MKTLSRNRQTLYYALYQGKTKTEDADGRYSGYILSYSSPVKAKMNIAPAVGTSILETFGISENYTHVIVTDDMDCPMDEHSIIWYGIDTTENYNFYVARKAKTLNHVIYALREVNGNVEAYTVDGQ